MRLPGVVVGRIAVTASSERVLLDVGESPQCDRNRYREYAGSESSSTPPWYRPYSVLHPLHVGCRYDGVRLGPMRIVACARDIGCAHARSNCRCLAVPCVSIRMAVLDKGDPPLAGAGAMSLSDPASGRKSSLVSTWRARREQKHDAAHAIGTLW